MFSDLTQAKLLLLAYSPERAAPSIAMAAESYEPNRMSRVKPLRGAEGALDILFGSQKR
jgi:hypothetical protein